MKYASERRNDEHLTELEGNSSDAASKCREVILVVSSDLLDETVLSESSQECGYLLGSLGRQPVLKVGVAKTCDVEFASDDSQKEVEVVALEQIETAVGSVVGFDRTGDLFKIAQTVGRVVDGGEELDIATVGVAEDVASSGRL